MKITIEIEKLGYRSSFIFFECLEFSWPSFDEVLKRGSDSVLTLVWRIVIGEKRAFKN